MTERSHLNERCSLNAIRRVIVVVAALIAINAVPAPASAGVWSERCEGLENAAAKYGWQIPFCAIPDPTE